MRRLLPLLLLPFVALAADEPILTVTGPNVSIVTIGTGQQGGIQCPGYQVAYKPGNGSTLILDGGNGTCLVASPGACATSLDSGTLLDFTLAGQGYDPYRAKLAGNQDRVAIGSTQTDGGYTCYVSKDTAQSAIQRTGR